MKTIAYGDYDSVMNEMVIGISLYRIKVKKYFIFKGPPVKICGENAMNQEKIPKLQPKDIKIIEALQENARLGVKKVARKTGIPITTVFNRIRNMESRGIIKGYRLELDKKKLGKEIEAYILINIAYTSDLHQEEFSMELNSLPEVDECYVISGATNILVKVSTKDIDTLNEFIINNLRKKGVEHNTTYIIIKEF